MGPDSRTHSRQGQTGAGCFRTVAGATALGGGIYRAIKEAGLFPAHTEQTFRRKWRSDRETPETWIKEHVHSINDLVKIMNQLGIHDSEVEAEISEIRSIAQRVTPATPVAIPIPSLKATWGQKS